MTILRNVAFLTVLTLGASPALAEISDGVVKIGVLNDQSSLYADLAGQGSVVAARMAVEDFGAAAKGLKVEIIFADHQNKADVGSQIARQWYDAEKVDMILDVPNSGVALAVNQITRDKGKAFLVSGAPDCAAGSFEVQTKVLASAVGVLTTSDAIGFTVIAT